VAIAMNRVAVFGGTGFLGRAVVHQLVAAGVTARVAVRHPEPIKLSDGTARAEHVRSVYADVADEASVGRALEGCNAAVNVVGLYVERGTDTFRTVHELGAMHVARQSARAGVKSLVHMSGIGANLNSQSSYVRSRARGELLVREAFPAATMLRPSVLFGPDDKFLNTLITILRRSPVLALFGAGNTRLQPVYVADVAKAVLRVLTTLHLGYLGTAPDAAAGPAAYNRCRDAHAAGQCGRCRRSNFCRSRPGANFGEGRAACNARLADSSARAMSRHGIGIDACGRESPRPSLADVPGSILERLNDSRPRGS
jgi:uncharacterized protein YbjT (DUF2867 family)